MNDQKGSSLSILNQIAGEMKQSQGGSKGKLTFLSYKDAGVHKFRILPAHPDSKSGSYIQMSKHYFTKRAAEVWINNEKTDQIALKPKKLYNAVQHGANIPNDPIELYKAHLAHLVTTEHFLGDRGPIEADVIGKFQRKPLWSMNMTTEGVVYAVQITTDATGKEVWGDVGILALKPSIVKRVHDITNSEMAEGQIVGDSDPFSDSVLGLPIIIKTNPNDIKNYYTTELCKKLGADRRVTEYPVPASIMNQLADMKSLDDVYVNVYNRNHFDWALEGIKYYDEERNIGLLKRPDFLAKLEELANYIPDAPTKDEVKTQAAVAPEATTTAPMPVTNMTDPSTMNRVELKSYIVTNELPVVVSSEMSDDDIRVAIHALKTPVAETAPIIAPEATSVSKTADETLDHLATLREKLGKQ